MQTVLDLDLDFFVWPIAYQPEGGGRLDEHDHKVTPAKSVRQFLTSRCSLKKRRKIPGHETVEHQDAFCTWRRWLRSGVLSAPFDVIHVDAHADLGLGDGGWAHLLSEVLALPVEQRNEPRFGPHALNSGNYLAFAIANRWIGNLTYVFPHPKAERREPVTLNVFVGETFMQTVSLGGTISQEDPRPKDLLHLLFRNRDAGSGLIELRRYSPDVVQRVGDATLELPEPIHVEPVIPFKHTPADRFRFEGFTHMTVAVSPQFTPPSADQLLPIFRDYFAEA